MAPIYTIVFVLIGLAALLSGEFNRRGQMHRLLVAILCIGLLEGLALALQDLAGRTPQLLPLMYLVPLLPVGVSVYVLLKRSGRRSVHDHELAMASE